MILFVKDSNFDLLIDFGYALRAIRNSRNLSQEELGQITGLDRTYISGLERGKRNPTLRVIASIASGLGITASELLKGITINHEKNK
jgi:transcriptional regulator with XRE-family HTH domain